MTFYNRRGRYEGQASGSLMNKLANAKRIAFEKIMFATDFSSYSNTALPYALAISHQYGSKMYAAHVLSPEAYFFVTPDTWPTSGEQTDVARLEMHLRNSLHQVLSPAGDISDVLFRLIRDNQIDLLVLGTHGRSGLSKVLMGSVAEKIFRLASIPVLTVGPRVSREHKSVAKFNQIVFATNFNDESVSVAPYALSLAHEYHARLSFLHVLEQPQTATVDFESNADFVIRRMREIVPSDADLWFRPQYLVEFGQVEDQILKFADVHKADLIVLGVRAPEAALTSVTHLAHSQAQHIVAHATCPVLTVRR
jgi:nucleotide-binding universal stress UspA family protein